MAPKKTQAKELQELQKTVAQQKRLLAEKDETICKLQEEQKAREFEEENRIPIPQGQAGHREGYKLFDKMGVSKETFQAMRTIIRYKTSQFLDVTKTIRHQDAKRLKHTLFQITKTLPFLSKYYESSWPIRPIMRQYLSSTHRAHKKAIKYMTTTKEVPTHFAAVKGSASTQKATETKNSNVDNENDGNKIDGNESDDDDDNSDEDDEEEEEDNGTDNWAAQLAEIEMEVREEASAQKKLKGGNAHVMGKKMRSAMGRTNTPPAAGGSNTRPAVEAGVRLSPDPEKDIRGSNLLKSNNGNAKPAKSANKTMPKKKSTTLNQEAEKENVVQNDSTEVGAVARRPNAQSEIHENLSQTKDSKGKLPSHCSVCKGSFPTNPSKKVKTLHAKLQAALRDPNTPRYGDGNQKGVNFMRLELCVAIQADLDFHKSYSVADHNNWPAPGVLDFQRVYNRILDLDKDGTIWGLLANDIVLRNSIAWQSFVARIRDVELVNEKLVKSSYALQQFLAMAAMKKFSIIDCVFGGYYGQAGEEVILAALQYHIFPPYKNPSTVLAATMTDVLEAEQEHPDRADFWKGFRPTGFSLEDFMGYVAGPFVANLLICQDHLITEAEAEVIRLESAEYGRTVNPTDEKIDDLVMMIAAPQRQPSPLSRMPDDWLDNHSADHIHSPHNLREASIPSWAARKQIQALSPLSPIPELDDSSSSQKRCRSDDADHEEQEHRDNHPKLKTKRIKMPTKSLPSRRSTRQKT